MHYRRIAFFLVFLHAALAIHAAWNLSPVWDEIVYPAAGYDLLTTGHLRTSLDHPPLGKVLVALPLFLQGTVLQTAPADSRDLEPFRYGFDFVYHNHRSARWIIFLPRLMNVFLSCLLALLIYFYAREIWGGPAGLLALASYVFLPAALARASLALLEMPLAFFMMMTLMTAARWRTDRQSRSLMAWALAWTAALLTKVNAVVLLPMFLVADLVPRERGSLVRRWLETVFVFGAAVGACEIVMRGLGHSYWTGQLLARKNDLMASRFPIYFNGSAWDAALFYMAPLAWLMKTPVPFVILAAGGWWVWKRTKPEKEIFILLSCGVLVTAIQMMAVRSIIATGQYFYLWPFLALIVSAAASEGSLYVQWAVRILAASLFLSCCWVHPQYLSYFNLLSGGSSRGYLRLSDSDQDWGQGLPALSHWMKHEKIPQILLGFSGTGDPRVYGISYQDVISPALLTMTYRGEIFSQWPGRVVLALGTKVIQTEGDLLEWLLRNRKPIREVGNTFLIYDLTNDSEAQKWLAWLYRSSHRPLQAAALPALKG